MKGNTTNKEVIKEEILDAMEKSDFTYPENDFLTNLKTIRHRTVYMEKSMTDEEFIALCEEIHAEVLNFKWS